MFVVCLPIYYSVYRQRITVPSVGNGLFRVPREKRRRMKRAHRVVYFSAAELVKSLVVHAASRPSALFPSDDHPAAPCHGFTYRNWFDYAPSAMYLSRSALTCSCQYRGIDICVWMGTGDAFGSTMMRTGGSSILGAILWHAWQLLRNSCIWRVITGQKTDAFDLAFMDVSPWWAACSVSWTWSRDGGITILSW